MKTLAGLSLALLLVVGCEAEPTTDAAAGEAEILAGPDVDPALLRELLGESVQVEGDNVRADGMLVRLAFDPLIREIGPVSVQLVQGQGYSLTGVPDGSPLWLLGLRDGDVLTGVDKQAILGREHELRSSYESRPGRVVLTYMRGTEARTLDLRIERGSAWRSTDAGGGVTDAPLRPPISPVPTQAVELTAEFGGALRCAEPEGPLELGRCELEREVFDKLLAAPEALMRQARIVPAVRDGETFGVKVFGIRPTSMPAMLGFKNGDLITSVNGHSLTNIDATMTAYEQARDAKEFRVALERQGQALEFELALVDALSGPATGLVPDSSPRPSPDLRDPFKR